MSLRAISAATGIPMRAVHRAKRQLEKSIAQQSGQKAPVATFRLPVSYLVKTPIRLSSHNNADPIGGDQAPFG